MGKFLTAAQLERRLTKAKAREAYREAQAKNPIAKPYKPKGDSDTVYVRSFEDDTVIVKMLVLKTSITKATAIKDALGWLTQTAAEALLAAKIFEFKAAHRQVLRIRINEANATPQPKNTPWGTRVVDMISNSYQLPFSLGADTSPTMKEAKSAFNALFSETGSGKTLIAKEGSYAELLYRGEVISVVR
ncbi:hypothetical protein [Microcoleus sp.]|uniref:hypothetical protein n=1 Tax=Microcoleus sp. TaxID=44472 RepID=UPI003526A501